MEDPEYEKHDKITEKTLKPITKVNSQLDKELQDWEVKSTKKMVKIRMEISFDSAYD